MTNTPPTSKMNTTLGRVRVHFISISETCISHLFGCNCELLDENPLATSVFFLPTSLSICGGALRYSFWSPCRVKLVPPALLALLVLVVAL